MDELTNTRVRQTHHLMVTFTVIFVASALCWLPFCVAFILLYVHDEPSIPLLISLWWSFPTLTINSMLNPVIYWWRLKEVREGFSRLMFGRCCRKNEIDAPLDTIEEAEL